MDLFMERIVKHHCQYKRNWLISVLIIFVLFCIQSFIVIDASYANTANSNIQINRSDNIIDISLKNADLKTVLLKIEKITNVHFYFSSSLKKKISLTNIWTA